MSVKRKPRRSRQMSIKECENIANRIREMYRRRRSSTGERGMVPSDVERFLKLVISSRAPHPFACSKCGRDVGFVLTVQACVTCFPKTGLARDLRST